MLVRASAAGRRFQSESWNGVVSLVVATVGTEDTTTEERTQAASELEDGRDVVIAGVRIHPER